MKSNLKHADAAEKNLINVLIKTQAIYTNNKQTDKVCKHSKEESHTLKLLFLKQYL